MVSGLCDYYAAFFSEDAKNLAKRVADALLDGLLVDDGMKLTLKRTMRDNPSFIPGYSEDYAFLIRGSCFF